MKILKGKTPKDTRDFDGDYPQDLDPTDVVEIFETPLTGSYNWDYTCLLYTSPSPRDKRQSRMPSSA